MNAQRDGGEKFESEVSRKSCDCERRGADGNQEGEKELGNKDTGGRRWVSDIVSKETQANEDIAVQETGNHEEKVPVSDRMAKEEHISEITEKEPSINPEDTVDGCGYPEIPDPYDRSRTLNRSDLRKQRILFWCVIAGLNIAFGLLTRRIYRIFKPLPPVPRQWILTLIPAYSESEEQIVKTIYSLRDNEVGKHRQVMVVLLDGKPRDVRSHLTHIIRDFERPYVSLKHKRGVLKITAGFAEDVPVIVIEKVKNSGKSES
ncbi:uncharacterized protein N0V89_001948 [Didymosphaeria variabile]|uniref:Uncharacterized protein n=1 Tax=Didymosphaeria variabile TaxID=1932322 RepID=A0A9W8XSK6_9PLEO|nr:uncharacterized protein N0V89_001948 [Didymosphaeria variabile]KAJ4357373.1 hypothetical protein N0V89_001948 [Didymosphaeria variabile]